jgi:hypothetical protein
MRYVGCAVSPHLPLSESLHARARAMVDAFEHGRGSPEPFDALAVDLARYQAAAVPGYARLCAARGVDPQKLTRAADAPAVPAEVFKLAPVFAFAAADATSTFRTSGTTIGARGAHSMRHTATYDAAALAFGRAMLARDLIGRVPVLVLGPSPEAAPDSSLTHMNALFVRHFGTDAPASETYFLEGDALRTGALRARIAGLRDSSGAATPAIVLATSFALVHWLDALDAERDVLPDVLADVLPLPPGSRVMQTGGFKGRSREVSAAELRAQVARAFAIDPRAVIGEYGMTELSSQFWEETLVDPRAAHGLYAEPPWARVVAVDPETLAPVPDGAVGIARIEDLANVDSAFAVLTQDRVRRVRAPSSGALGAFELLGRAPGAAPRGCSIGIDEMLSGLGPTPARS